MCNSSRVPPRVKDLSGEISGRLRVTAFAGFRGKGRSREAQWLCHCDCGNDVVVGVGGLHRKYRPTGSCGCRQQDWALRGLAHVTHGKSRLPEYGIWCAMIRRCENRRDANYARYGGRGIRVCARWRNSFVAFIRDMGPRPSAEYTIERRRVNGSYIPSNCCWLHRDAQARNRRNNHFIRYNGSRRTLAEWSERTGIKGPTILARRRRGWSWSRVFTSPVRANRRTNAAISN